MSEDNANLSPNASPNTVGMGRKGARRVNRRPLAIGIGIVAVIAATLGSAAMNRGGVSQSGGGGASGRAAMDQAREFTSGQEAGIVAANEPEPPQAGRGRRRSLRLLRPIPHLRFLSLHDCLTRNVDFVKSAFVRSRLRWTAPSRRRSRM